MYETFDEGFAAGLKNGPVFSRYRRFQYWLIWQCYNLFYEIFNLLLIPFVALIIAAKDAWLGNWAELE